jgi:hypothetical protein
MRSTLLRLVDLVEPHDVGIRRESAPVPRRGAQALK